jgi:hypothetical protein
MATTGTGDAPLESRCSSSLVAGDGTVMSTIDTVGRTVCSFMSACSADTARVTCSNLGSELKSGSAAFQYFSSASTINSLMADI